MGLLRGSLMDLRMDFVKASLWYLRSDFRWDSYLARHLGFLLGRHWDYQKVIGLGFYLEMHCDSHLEIWTVTHSDFDSCFSKETKWGCYLAICSDSCSVTCSD